MIQTITLPFSFEVSQRKLEVYAKYCKVINWGRMHPIEFGERFMGVEYLDYQKYLELGTWTADFALWLMCRNGGKTTEAATYIMKRSLLFPFHATHILGNTGAQSKEVFTKIEKLAKKEIESFTGATEFFFDEAKKNGVGIAAGDPFAHYPDSYRVELFNGSSINTLNSDTTNIKGKRSNLVVFDESGWFSDELFIQAEQFVNQDENFKLGGNIDLTEEPLNFPRQILYCSSASDTESGFYKKFRMFTKQMIMGNHKYFVCNLNADAVRNATLNGESYPSLLNEDKIQKALDEDREKALRELYNKFTSESHEGQILTRRMLMQYTKDYVPDLRNPDGLKRYMLSWDSARINDGSIIVAAELINDPQIGWRMELKNIIALVDPSTKNKTPMRMQEQVAAFQKVLIDYNGSEYGKMDYENIHNILMDSGPAGQMYSICDNMVPDFTGPDGKVHRGIIDSSHKLNERAVLDFPNAVDNVIMVDPKGRRVEIFQALEDMVKLGVVSFPVAYEGKPYVSRTIIDENGQEREKIITLTDQEQISLMQFELLKTELITMCRYVNSGNVKYAFPPDKQGRMHDDRIYAFGLLCWRLAQLRRGQTLAPQVEEEKTDRPMTVSNVDFDF